MIIGTEGDDLLSGTDLGEYISGAGGNDTLTGAGGDDTLYGADGSDSLFGGDGNDWLNGGELWDTLDGGGGDDTLTHGLFPGDMGDGIVLTGGDGVDLLILSYWEFRSSIRFSVADVMDHEVVLPDGARVSGIERVNIRLEPPNAADATLVGGSFDDTMEGGFTNSGPYAGDARFEGREGNDSLISGSGNDLLLGGAGADTLGGGYGSDTLQGGAGDDLLGVVQHSDASDVLDGGDGVDVLGLYYSGMNSGLVLSVRDQLHGVVTLFDGTTVTRFERISIAGSGSAANSVRGGPLADSLAGGAGDDTLRGGGGDDTIASWSGTDNLSGGAGDDTYLVYEGDSVHADAMIEYRSGGIDTIVFANQTEVSGYKLGANFENLTFLAYSSTRITLSGNELDNVLHGNPGGNRLLGYRGNDTLDGGLGHDLLVGGGGSDTFAFSTIDQNWSSDAISDFAVGTDQLRFDPGVFTEIGSTGLLDPAAFQSGAGLVAALEPDDRLIYDTSSGVLYYDRDGSGSAQSFVVARLGYKDHPDISTADIVIGT